MVPPTKKSYYKCPDLDVPPDHKIVFPRITKPCPTGSQNLVPRIQKYGSPGSQNTVPRIQKSGSPGVQKWVPKVHQTVFPTGPYGAQNRSEKHMGGRRVFGFSCEQIPEKLKTKKRMHFFKTHPKTANQAEADFLACVLHLIFILQSTQWDPQKCTPKNMSLRVDQKVFQNGWIFTVLSEPKTSFLRRIQFRHPKRLKMQANIFFEHFSMTKFPKCIFSRISI